MLYLVSFVNLRVSASPTVSESTNPRSRFPKFIDTQRTTSLVYVLVCVVGSGGTDQE